MNSLLNSVVRTLFICLVFFKCGSAVLCYDCNSAFDPRCGEEFDSFSLGIVNCSLRDPPEHLGPVESKFCRSIKMEIFGKVRIVRKCGYLFDDEVGNHTCRRVVGIGDLFVTHCTCDSDLCNSAFTHNRREMALFASIVILWFLVL